MKPGVLEIDGCVVASKSAKVSGGGIFHIGGMALSGTTISGNSSVDGGGIADMAQYHSNTAYPYPVIADLSNCTISANSAKSAGGGILNLGTLSLTDCTVSANSAKQGGGGAISTEEAIITLTNDTLTANRTTATGEFAAALGTITSVGNIFLYNTFSQGDDHQAGACTVHTPPRRWQHHHF